ncbi:AP-4 complex accessory subunit Tepsin-like [Oratosquilla oratoria]|uniref:AP-4 complex accessory subunit Tepsin-like n=1 Tax=Oratosquilla oratoria TaxID=337810 RepID=UPI003F768A35
MNFIQDAKITIDFTTYYPMLMKATTDNDAPVPGYLHEEVLKLSQVSSGHRQQLLDFLLTRLAGSTWAGKQKIVRLLQQLSSRGHREMRILLRQRDGELRKAASSGGPPDPVLSNTPQLFLNSSIQELLTLLFDPYVMQEDEEWIAAGLKASNETAQSPMSLSIAHGLGSASSGQGKYEGFGPMAPVKNDNIVEQVRGMVEKVISPSAEAKRISSDLMQGSMGDYQPLQLNSLPIPPAVTPPNPSGIGGNVCLPTVTHSGKHRVHVAGRAGGGWESDEEVLSPSPKSCTENELAQQQQQEEGKQSEAIFEVEEDFLSEFIADNSTWPIERQKLQEACQKCTSLNSAVLLDKVGKLLDEYIPEVEEVPEKSTEEISEEPAEETKVAETRFVVPIMALLLLLEFAIHNDVIPPSLIHSSLQKLLPKMWDTKILAPAIQIKAKKVHIIVDRLSVMCHKEES